MAISLAGFATAAQAQQITGAGSSFAAPIYTKWAEANAGATGTQLNYQAVGSGAGINQINNRTVDFGASDMPVKPEALAEHKLMQFPTVIGGVDIIVNLPGIKPKWKLPVRLKGLTRPWKCAAGLMACLPEKKP